MFNVAVVAFEPDLSQIRTIALAGSVLPVIIGLLLFRIIAGAFARAFILVIALVVGGVIYFQRQEISDCVADAKASVAQLEEVAVPAIQCEVFGFDLSVQP